MTNISFIGFPWTKSVSPSMEDLLYTYASESLKILFADSVKNGEISQTRRRNGAVPEDRIFAVKLHFSTSPM